MCAVVDWESDWDVGEGEPAHVVAFQQTHYSDQVRQNLINWDIRRERVSATAVLDVVDREFS